MPQTTKQPTSDRKDTTAKQISDFAAALAAPAAVMPRSNVRDASIVISFAATLFVSATLLFLVQPMVGKMILPLLGGTPAVWNTCMVFFQAVLLAGYAYAHVTSTWLGVRRQAVLHAAILLSALLVLPIAVRQEIRPPTNDQPVFWLLGQLLLCVGLPFFVVSTTSPLLQKWFSGTGHRNADDPFFLYAAGNVGSLLALLGYPIILQPITTLTQQSWLWSVGYGVLIVMIMLCAWIAWRSPAANTPRLNERPVTRHTRADVHLNLRVDDAPRPYSHGSEEARRDARKQMNGCTRFEVTGRRRMWWIFTAFVPSSLMLGVTAHVTSNLAPVPLLWVLPLAMYLLTMILVFARRTWIPHSLMTRTLPFLVLPVMVLTFLELPAMAWLAIVAHMVTFFVAAMVCHGELARSRPTTDHLTEFYLWMSVGGVLGGIFNALIAPSLFTIVAEYPLAMVAACFVLCRAEAFRAAPPHPRTAIFKDIATPVGVASLAVGTMYCVHATGMAPHALAPLLMFLPPLVLCFSFKDRPVRFALGFAAVAAVLSFHSHYANGTPMYAGRNFFGVKRVVLDSDGQLRKFVHGTTFHGIQFVDPGKNREPLAYYHRTGPIGDVFRACSGPLAKQRVAAIGLGAGAVASYAEPGQHFTFYEIDPEVARIAADEAYFSFLSQCRGAYDIVLGDGRLTMADARDQSFGLMIVDAFSSDSIPTHLLTREALELYKRKLEPDGVIAFHVSNSYLDLKPLLGTLASEAGMMCWWRDDLTVPSGPEFAGKSPSQWVVMARSAGDIGHLPDDPNWHPLPPTRGFTSWTDQHSSLLSIFRWH